LRLRVTLNVRHEYTYSPHPVGLLRPRRERPRNRHTAEKRDEVAPLHVPPKNTLVQCLKLSTL
jgi:hypothetical protein